MFSLVPIISVGVGGALAILGAYINSLTSHRRQRNAESRDRVANKLEDAARLADSIRKSGMALRARVLVLPLNSNNDLSKDEIKKVPSSELFLLLKLYDPSLLPYATSLADAEKTIGHSVVKQISDWAFNDKPTTEKYEQFANDSEKLVLELDRAYESFMTALAARFSDYRLN